MRWTKDKKYPIWRLRGKGLRRGYGPSITIHGRYGKHPGVWSACTSNFMGVGFPNPSHLRRYIELLQKILDKWERLIKQHPDVIVED